MYQRVVICSFSLSNYEKKPHYLLTVMRVFNEGVQQWRTILDSFGINEIFYEMFKIFFLFDGVTSIPPDDKKFNFIFASVDEPLRKLIKQGIIKTVIYLAKEFP